MVKGNKYIRNIKLHQLGIDVDEKYIEIYNFLEENLNNLKEFKSDKNPKSLYYGKDKGNIVLEWYNYKGVNEKTDTLYVDYIKIWDVFKTKYKIKYDDIQVIITWYISITFNLLTPSNITNFYTQSVIVIDNSLKLKPSNISIGFSV